MRNLYQLYFRIMFLSIIQFLWIEVSAQVIPTSGQNYIVKRTPRVGTTSVAELQNLPAAKQGAVIEYYDGLGRPLQTVGVAATPDPKSANALDLVTPHVYDGMGREYRQLLPYATGGAGAYQPNAVDAGYSAGCDHYKFYNPAVPNGIAPDTRPFGETVYDGSPLSRVVSQTGPGSRWQSHPVGTAYGTNAAGEVTLWTVNDAGALVNSSTYGAGTLYRAAVTDEDGGVAVEYKDFEGRVVRKVADTNGVKGTTDYVYDDLGRLRWVLPPKITKGTGTPTTNDLNVLAYRYKYDGYGRMIEKKLPGVDSVGMVYDGRDRLVAIQDGVLRKSGRWLYTRYDALNRPVETGYLTNGVQRQDSMQLRVNKAFTGSPQYDTPSGNEYARNSFPRVVGGVSKDGTVSAITYTFYDSYDNGTPLAYDAAKAYSQTRAINVTGLPTVSRVKELTTHTWSTTATYYDEKGRVIQTVKKGLYPDPNGTMTVSTELNFVGQPTRVKEEQFFKPSATASAIATSIERRYDYFDSGQLRGVYAKLNNAAAEEVLATYTYDSLGRVQQKVYGGTAQKQRYKYNIRGWLTDINNPASTSATDYFAMKLGYDTPEVAGAGVVGQYGGSISSMVWRTKMVDGTQNKKGYGFAYDGLDRLKGSSYATGENLSASGAYTEKSLLYDENGNIKSLTRTNGASTATVYSYTYQNNNNSNQLLNITGGLENYEYDANGNATKDGNKGFRIFYNELNLPQAVAKGTEYVSYVYDATGAKLAMDMSKINSTARYYHGSMVYAKDTNKTTQKAEYKIDYVLHEEGTIKVTTSGSSTTYAYQYNLKDHLGNTRAMFSKAAGAGQTPVLAQATDYYPFGKSFEQNNMDKNRYLYNGKELQDQVIGGTPFGWYDYGARFYDPEIARWHSIDPKAEVSRRWSPYNYCYNNPLRFIDPDGMLVDDYYSSMNGRKLGSDGAATNNMRLIDDETYNNISESNGGTTNAAATTDLQNNSKIITVDNTKIQSDLQNVRDETRTSGVENQINIVLDRKTATITSQRGAPGDNKSCSIDYYPAPATGVNFETPGGRIIIGEVHGHPLTTDPNMVNESSTSSNDAATAKDMNMNIYAIDAYSGSRSANQVSAPIHRVTSNGTVSNNVGKTIGNGTRSGAGAFDIGRDAMQYWGNGFPH